MIELRPYQDTCIAGLREAFRGGYRSPLLVSPTGSGKTVTFSYLTSKLLEAGKRVVLLCHREELVDQISRTLAAFEVRHGLITASALYDRRLFAHVASVATLVRRLDRVAVPDYVICDEAHHCIGASMWGKVIAYWQALNPALRVIGVTATPERLSGEGLGEVFDEMILGPTTGELIEIGSLAPYRLIAPPGHGHDFDAVKKTGGDFNKKAMGDVFRSKPAIVGDAVREYDRLLQGAPSVAFCISVEEAEKTAEKFRAAGYRAASVDGKMEKDDRRRVVKDFASGQLNVLTSCDLVSEGFDVPGIVGAIMLRPTYSLALYLQQVGRALRPAPGKDAAVILDHVANSGHIEGGVFVPKHGLPDDPREWSLLGRAERRKKGDEENVACRQCVPYENAEKKMVGGCYAVSPAAADKCRECKVPFQVRARKIEEVAGSLSEVEIAKMRREAVRAQAAAETLEDLIRLGEARGFKAPDRWAAHIIKAREEKRARARA